MTVLLTKYVGVRQCWTNITFAAQAMYDSIPDLGDHNAAVRLFPNGATAKDDLSATLRHRASVSPALPYILTSFS